MADSSFERPSNASSSRSGSGSACPPTGWKGRRPDRHLQPPREGGGTLRVTSEVLRHGGPPGDGDLAAATRVILRQTAENFVRPDDPRGSDRIIDQLDDGSLIASYSARTEIDGDKLVIYLWMRGKAMAEDGHHRRLQLRHGSGKRWQTKLSPPSLECSILK